jgi:polyhydroxyalkanoate synthesis regulator phasin
MLELLEKAAMNVLGAAALTQKKGEELLAELKTRYHMSEDEGRQFLERLQEMGKAGRDRATEMAEGEIKGTLNRLGMVSREDFDKLERRVRVLEAALKQGEAEEPGEGC